MKEWENSIHKLNLAVKWSDFEAASNCFDELNERIRNKRPIPYKLLNKFFSYLVDSTGVDEMRSSAIEKESQPYIEKAKKHFENKKGYFFNGEKEVIVNRIEFDLNPTNDKSPKTFINKKAYSSDEMIEEAIVAYLKQKEKKQSKDAIFKN
jgi:metal-responsive CopG/Arc/MetJ family transcriptional regulator